MNTLYADIILPFPLPGTFTYKVPDSSHDMAVAGMRVEVSFRKKVYTGIIFATHEKQPNTYSVKEILHFPDPLPIIAGQQLVLWEWMATYYMCTLGEIFNAAVPALFKLSSASVILLNQKVEIDKQNLSDREFLVAEALTLQAELSLQEIQQILGIRNVQPILRTLMEKGVILIKEEIRDTYKPKTQKVVELDDRFADEDALQALFSELEKLTKQQQLLMVYYQLALQHKEIRKAALLKKAGVSASVLQTMVGKGIFHEVDAEVSRLKKVSGQLETNGTLSIQQETAKQAVIKCWEGKDVVLLHGVTGSGKTEIYMDLMASAISQGLQVLYLLPEIALTAQIITRLRKRFGDKVGIYHSKFNHSERIEIWQHVQDGRYQIVLGARSALYLPFKKLGLTIIDEEHDYSFKQQDPAPRYHARDTAIYLSSIWKGKTLMGSATPSIESYHHAHTGKYGYVELTERYAGMLLPKVHVVDMKKALKERANTNHFSKVLLEALQQTIDGKEQAILFQNRRGYSPYIICGQCGWSPNCIQCDVKLVYHKNAAELRCHYCGYKHALWNACAECGSTQLLIQGFGTEMVEDELQSLYPDFRIARLDMDAVRTKTGHEKVLADFEDGQTDILVGTQMVTKGLDFDNVNLVGILSADQILNFSDFRASERGYQLMMQVSGRAGRKHRQGTVLIQAMNVAHPVLDWVVKHETHPFYKEELDQRMKFGYPPYVRLVRIILKHKEQAKVLNAAYALVKGLGTGTTFQILGPVQPGISRVRNKYLVEILIKMSNNGKVMRTVKEKVLSARTALLAINQFKQVDVILDVDPT